MKDILKIVEIYGNKGYDEIEESKKQGFQVAGKTYCFRTLLDVWMWKQIP